MCNGMIRIPATQGAFFQEYYSQKEKRLASRAKKFVKWFAGVYYVATVNVFA